MPIYTTIYSIDKYTPYPYILILSLPPKLIYYPPIALLYSIIYTIYILNHPFFFLFSANWIDYIYSLYIIIFFSSRPKIILLPPITIYILLSPFFFLLPPILIICSILYTLFFFLCRPKVYFILNYLLFRRLNLYYYSIWVIFLYMV